MFLACDDLLPDTTGPMVAGGKLWSALGLDPEQDAPASRQRLGALRELLTRACRAGTRAIDLVWDEPQADALARVPVAICRFHNVVPVRLDKDAEGVEFLILAVADETYAEAIGAVQEVAGCKVEAVFADPDQIEVFNGDCLGAYAGSALGERT